MGTLPKYLSGEIKPRPQPEEGTTYTKMLKKENNGWILRNRQSNWNAVCAHSTPGQVLILNITVIHLKSNAPPLCQENLKRENIFSIKAILQSVRLEGCWFWRRSARRGKNPCKAKLSWQEKRDSDQNHLTWLFLSILQGAGTVYSEI